MANEITLNLRLDYASGNIADKIVIDNLSVTTSTTTLIHNRQAVGTSEEALLLGDVAAGGYLIGVNRGATDYIEIRNATGGGDLIRMKPGEPCCFRLSSDATAPFVISDGTGSTFEYLLLGA